MQSSNLENLQTLVSMANQARAGASGLDFDLISITLRCKSDNKAVVLTWDPPTPENLDPVIDTQ